MDPLLTAQVLTGPHAALIVLGAWVLWMRKVNEELKKDNKTLREAMDRQWRIVEQAVNMIKRMMKDLGMDNTGIFSRDDTK